MSKPRDYGYEALAEATNTDLVGGRGELNISLKTIRAQSPELEYAALADEIHRRAKMYRDVFGEGITLTATALAKHWVRVLAESQPSERGVNRNSGHEDCVTCEGNRFVVVYTRKPTDSQWMLEHSIKADETAMIEEMAPCPDCNPDCDTGFYRFNGRRFESPDADRVRELLRS